MKMLDASRKDHFVVSHNWGYICITPLLCFDRHYKVHGFFTVLTTLKEIISQTVCVQKRMFLKTK